MANKKDSNNKVTMILLITAIINLIKAIVDIVYALIK